MNYSDIPAEIAQYAWPFAVLYGLFRAWEMRERKRKKVEDEERDNRIREILTTVLNDKEHRMAMREEGVEALRTPEGRGELLLAAREASAEALESLSAHLSGAQIDHERRISSLEESRKSQGERIGRVQEWTAMAEASLDRLEELDRRTRTNERMITVHGATLARLSPLPPEPK